MLMAVVVINCNSPVGINEPGSFLDNPGYGSGIRVGQLRGLLRLRFFIIIVLIGFTGATYRDNE